MHGVWLKADDVARFQLQANPAQVTLVAGERLCPSGQVKSTPPFLSALLAMPACIAKGLPIEVQADLQRPTPQFRAP
jgi:hypothetical protein